MNHEWGRGMWLRKMKGRVYLEDLSIDGKMLEMT